MEKYNDENKKAQKTVEVIKDKELEQMIGGVGPGLVRTLTKDCPNVVPKVCFDGKCKYCR
ncbi:type A2 lantipeptide [Dolosigranulum pigrum]|uniref:type A2 lanthipeptide n=1 Tax=Dolosigranulum pigrum TaxID=29394 RepID=UPI001AD88473|nr:type A2 lanthipeptide [Dolosigranulum pigrum]QTJ49849.1 type A2 lantipeptide [Dolosigranulum pigrum]